MISIISDPSLTYPDASDFYSPDERFPEYRYAHVSARKNPIYRAVRDCFRQADLDQEHYGTSSWNPLGAFIRPGSRVFVLCNFVFHRRPNESNENFLGKCIHGSVLRALIDYLLMAVGETGTVCFGNAAMQGCHWESVLRDTGAHVVQEFYQSNGIPVKAKDLRLFVMERNQLGAVTRVERRSDSDGVQVKLCADSLLTELDREPATRYRVMNYDPRRTEAFHAHGSHVYVMNRQILEADVIVSLPKLKTHEKVGITCALKGFVGAIGHKDSLPHYRLGPPEIGGDECPSDRKGLLRMASAFHGWVQQAAPDRAWGNFLRVTDRSINRVVGPWLLISEGGWWGNDTAWRMVLDLARIAMYATATGEMQTVPARRHLVFIDGVVGGEGQGPLRPTAVRSGLLLLSDNLVVADYVSALMMGFDPERIPMIREAIHLPKYPLIEHSLTDEQVRHNGRLSSISELGNLAQHHYEPPLGWKGKL